MDIMGGYRRLLLLDIQPYEEWKMGSVQLGAIAGAFFISLLISAVWLIATAFILPIRKRVNVRYGIAMAMAFLPGLISYTGFSSEHLIGALICIIVLIFQMNRAKNMPSDFSLVSKEKRVSKLITTGIKYELNYRQMAFRQQLIEELKGKVIWLEEPADAIAGLIYLVMTEKGYIETSDLYKEGKELCELGRKLRASI